MDASATQSGDTPRTRRGSLATCAELGPPVIVPGVAAEEALRIANDSSFGLYGAVFTRDNAAAYRIARGIRAGTVSQNVFRFDSALPFGGFKQSGLGREGGREGLAGCTELKSIRLA